MEVNDYEIKKNGIIWVEIPRYLKQTDMTLRAIIRGLPPLLRDKCHHAHWIGTTPTANGMAWGIIQGELHESGN